MEPAVAQLAEVFARTVANDRVSAQLLAWARPEGCMYTVRDTHARQRAAWCAGGDQDGRGAAQIGFPAAGLRHHRA
jgi:hypothetical protein